MKKGMKEGWYIGIDFGTTNTYIAAYYKGAKGKEDRFYTNDTKWLHINEQSSGNRIEDTNNNIPTLATMDAKFEENYTLNKEILIGQTALNRPCLSIFPDLKSAARQLTPPDGLFGNSSQRPRQYPFGQCSLETKLQFGNENNPCITTVRELVVEFFKKILHINDDNFEYTTKKDTVQKIVIGCPATREIDKTTSATYPGTLKDILTECFLGKKTPENEKAHEAFKEKIEVEAEPILAGETYLFGDGESDKNVLVVDIGGGTTDFSIVHYYREETGELHTEADISASCEIAGNAIDNYIFDLLPDGFQRSKNRCRTAKERLFNSEDNRGDLGPIHSPSNLYLIPDNKNVGDAYNYISFNEGELYLDGKLKKRYVKEDGKWKVIKTADKNTADKNTAAGIEQIIYEPIWNKLNEMLKEWKGGHPDKSIDTIFFVGGTSVIEPLRTYLKNKVDESFGISGQEKKKEITVETLFGANQKTLEAVGAADSDPIKITSYNAVAIGAFIRAIGQQCAIKPRVTFEWIGANPPDPFEEDKGHIFLQTSGKVVVPTNHIVYEPYVLAGYMRIIQGEINKNPIEWTVGGEVHQWVIKTRQGEEACDVLNREIEKAGDRRSNVGAVIVLSRSNENDAQCNFYICRNPSIDVTTETNQEINISKYVSKNKDIKTTVIKDLNGREIPLVKLSNQGEQSWTEEK